MSEAKCLLPSEDQDEKYLLHVANCETIANALDLRTKESSMFKSLSIEYFGIGASDFVNEIIGESACREFILDTHCTNDNCFLVHNVQLNFDLQEYDSKTSFILFSRWYFSNSKLPNFKVLLTLLSFLNRDFGDELLLTILCFSTALSKVAPNFRRPLGIKLIEKLVNLVGLTKTDAIRTIIIFNVTHDTEAAIITDLLLSLGVYEDMTNLYESVCCIWHISGHYSFPHKVLFAILKEFLQKMPPDFGVIKDKIIEQVLKCPRCVLSKHFHVIERILIKYYALNSQAGHKVRCFAYYGEIPEPDDSIRKPSYRSSVVKSLGPVNSSWKYLDVNEELQKSLGRQMCRILLGDDQNEDKDSEVLLSSAQNFNLEELLDFEYVGGNSTLLSTTDLLKYVSSTQEALQEQDYKQIYYCIVKSFQKNGLDSYLSELYNMLIRIDRCELPRAVFECLSCICKCECNKTRRKIRERFTVTINSIALMFYENRDFKSALKLLKTLRMCNVNPLGFPPEQVGEKLFAVVCSEIHFECLCVRDAVRILCCNDCLNYVSLNCTLMLSSTFCIIERVVVKILAFLVKKRLPALALELFRAVFLVQKDLYFPIDIGKYYERVFCYSFVKCKESCVPLDGVHLFLLVYTTCKQEEVFHSTTYRSLIVDLVRSRATSDIVFRTLQLCIHYRVYPSFTSGSIILGTHLLVEEMYVYLLHCFQKVHAQRTDSSQRSYTVKLLVTPKPTEKGFPFLEDLKKVGTEISHAAERFKEAFSRIVGPETYLGLSLNFLSPSEVVIPWVTIETVLGDEIHEY